MLRKMLWILAFCSLKMTAQEVTYRADIAPLIAENCLTCHRAGKIGPMPLTTYREVVPYAQMISYVTEHRLMPPYLPAAPTEDFLDVKRLTAAEIELFKKWLAAGLPEGEERSKNVQSAAPEAPLLQNPDTIIGMAQAFEQYGIYYDQYRVFVLPTHFAEDKVIEAVEFVPGNSEIVRACNISADPTDRVQVLDEWDPQYGYFSFGELGFVPRMSRFYNWYPGKSRVQFPENTGKILPAGANLLLHIHYGPTGTPQRDSSHIRLKFAEKMPAEITRNLPLLNPLIMSNDTFLMVENEKTRVHASFRLPFAVEVFGIQPHGHFLLEKAEIFAVFPDGRRSEILLEIEAYDFHHKQQFLYKKPKVLPAGTTVHALFHYDNTAENLFNPSDPPRTMTQGKRMYEEMFLTYFDCAPVAEIDPAERRILSLPEMLTEPTFILKFYQKEQAFLQAEVRSFAGETVIEAAAKKFDAGANVLKIDMADAPFGNYFVQLEAEDGKRVIAPFVYVPGAFFE